MARNVRRYRQERGLSIGELARRSGLSKQTLSKIELGTGNPTVETLAHLGSALEVSIRRLLTEWGSPVYVQRDTPEVWTVEQYWCARLLDEVYGSGYVRTTVLRLDRNEATTRPVGAHSRGTLHHLFVLTGRLRTGPAHETVTLRTGDFVCFPGDVPHVYDCLTERATVHIVTTSPQVRQGPTPARDSSSTD